MYTCYPGIRSAPSGLRLLRGWSGYFHYRNSTGGNGKRDDSVQARLAATSRDQADVALSSAAVPRPAGSSLMPLR